MTARAVGGGVQNPITSGADGTACRHAVTGLQDAGDVADGGSGPKAESAYTAVDPSGTIPATSSPTARAGVGGVVPRGRRAAAGRRRRSTLISGCADGKPTFTPTSRVGSITLGDTPLMIDGAVQPVTDALRDALHAVVSVRLNEVVDLPGGGKAVRAAHVTVGEGDGTDDDVIVAESRIDLAGAACDPVAGGTPVTPAEPDVCPDGSVLNAATSRCVIPVPGTQTPSNPAGDLTGSGSIVVGKPIAGPSGGTVISLAEARRRYPGSPCVRGAGPAYVVVGTKGRNRLTGTNGADRILGGSTPAPAATRSTWPRPVARRRSTAARAGTRSAATRASSAGSRVSSASSSPTGCGSGYVISLTN